MKCPDCGKDMSRCECDDELDDDNDYGYNDWEDEEEE